MNIILIICSLIITEHIHSLNTQTPQFSPSRSHYSSRATNITHTHDYHFESQHSRRNNQKDVEETNRGIFSIFQTKINILTPSTTTAGTSKRIKGRQNSVNEGDIGENEPHTEEPNGNKPSTPIGDIPWILILAVALVYSYKSPIYKLKI
jgi:hypothetical protein